ncbi:MAG TPA: LEA type 2 family protein [Gemmatimonadales bacterium]|nr:LEA type 2 family protein [Gemmatimonadales bacterium]
MKHSPRLVVLLAAGLAACTPLGAWVYDVPRFTVAAIRADTSAGENVALEVSLTGCNVNDYDLTADSLATQLTLGGQPVSSSTYGDPFALPMRDSATIVLAMYVPRERIREIRGGKGDGNVSYALRTVSTVRTPMGARIVDSWHRGTLRLEESVPVSWNGSPQLGCRPGTSVLPPAAGRGSGVPLPTARQPELPPGMGMSRPEQPR